MVRDLDLSKKKYKKIEVESLLKEQSDRYEEEVSLHKIRIDELIKENKKLSLKIEQYKKNERKALSVLEKAEEKAESILKNALEKYKLETERLKSFVIRFNAYFAYLFEKYPLYPEIVKAKETFDKLYILLADSYGQEVVDNASTVITDDKPSKATKKTTKKKENVETETGFDINEVLNPGELNLEDLCKELGLLEDE